MKAALPENRCPDCLYMKLVGRPKIRSSSNPHRVDLLLTINFNEQWEKLPGGRVKFGLRSGELRLELTQGSIPYKLRRTLSKDLSLNLKKERQSCVSSSAIDESQASLGMTLKSETDIQAKVNKATKSETIVSQSDNFIVLSCQVTTKGSPDRPAWVFETQTGDPVLKGLLTQTRLATVALSDVSWKVKAIFEVPSLKDVVLTETDGPWLRNASPQKRTILEIGLAKLLLKHKLKPYISYMEIHHE